MFSGGDLKTYSSPFSPGHFKPPTSPATISSSVFLSRQRKVSGSSHIYAGVARSTTFTHEELQSLFLGSIEGIAVLL
jgi:hypothetical protein